MLHWAKRREMPAEAPTQLCASFGTPYAFDPPAGCAFDEVAERPYDWTDADGGLSERHPACASALVFGERRDAMSGRHDDGARGGRGTDPVPDRSYGLPSGHTAGPLTLPFAPRVFTSPQPSLIIERRRSGREHEASPLIGVCGTAMARFRPRPERPWIRRGVRPERLSPDERLPGSQGHHAAGYSADHITADLDLVVVGNAIPWQCRARGSSRSEDPHCSFRSGSRSLSGRAFDCDCRNARKTTTTSLSRTRRRPERAGRRHRAQFR